VSVEKYLIGNNKNVNFNSSSINETNKNTPIPNEGESKYFERKRIDLDLGSGILLWHFKSESKSSHVEKNGTVKHVVVKSIPDRFSDKIKSNVRKKLMADAYLSRILHKIIPHAPKGKFISTNEYSSRLYPYDGKNYIENIPGLCLFEVL
jgi:hypothetical protein